MRVVLQSSPKELGDEDEKISAKQILDFTKEGNISQIHKILLTSDSKERDVDSDEEEDAIIPDFRKHTEDPQEPCHTSLSSYQVHTYVSRTSDFREEESQAVDEDDLHISNEDESQVSNEDKLVVVNSPPNLYGNRKQAKDVKSSIEAWKLCFTEENLKLITQFFKTKR
ncbi:hypothetical protein FQA39_LY07106 [Lamprigera yunnana]|nr:hypothetical protein FQA39_LY07106 [Lamprigera yunnana]